MDLARSTSAARYAGTRVHRVEDERLLTGHGTFVDDIVRPGMVHACFVRSPLARARIVGIDISAALALPGVAAVFVASDLNPDVREPWYSTMGKDVPDTPRPPMAEGEVRFVGDLVALVIAESRYVAEDAAELVDVEYEPLPPLVDYVEAQQSTELVHEGYAGNVAGRLDGAKPAAVEEACASAAFVVTRDDLPAGICRRSDGDARSDRGVVASGELTMWAATQAPHEVRVFAPRLLGLPEHRIRVIMRDTGGGFGQKTVPMREEMCLMLAARKVPAPVKWIEDRRENLMAAGQARHEHGDLRMAFDSDGTILAAQIDHVQDVGAYPTPWPVGDRGRRRHVVPGAVPDAARHVEDHVVFSNTSGRTAYRGPWQFETVAREVLLDIAARRDGHGSRRPAAPQHPRGATSCRTPTRTG